jgi:multidrug efflux pump subunit AcrA (membrane-fusion protein)
MSVPNKFVSLHENGVFLVDGKITEHPVKLGIRSNDKVEILSGLQSGDKIVKQPQKYLQYTNRRIRK